MAFLFNIILILVSAFVMGKIAEWLKIPIVVGQLLAGLIIGPGLLNLIHLNGSLKNLADLGVIILMFLAGLNSDVQLLKKYLKPSLIVALVGILFPMIITSIFGILISWPTKDALFLGVIFSATSVSITVEVLREMRKLNSREGITILGAAVADDVLTVVLLGITVAFTGEQLRGQITAGMNSGLIIGLQILFFVVIFIIAKYCIKPLLKIFQRISFPYAVSIMALIIGLLFAEGAELIGLSAITGSFFAGLIIGQHPVKRLVDNQISSLGYLLLIPTFFVSIGLEMKWSGIIDQWALFIALTFLAVITKLIGAGLGSHLMGFKWSSSFVVGAGMVSRGEVALIIAQIVYVNHLLSVDQYSTIIGAIIASTIISPFILKLSFKLIK